MKELYPKLETAEKEIEYETYKIIEPTTPSKPPTLTKIGSLHKMPVYKEVVDTICQMFGDMQVKPSKLRSVLAGYFEHKVGPDHLRNMCSKYLTWMSQNGYAEKVKYALYNVYRARIKLTPGSSAEVKAVMKVNSTYTHWTPTPKEKLDYDLKQERQHGVCPNCGNINKLHKYQVKKNRGKCEKCEKEYLLKND